MIKRLIRVRLQAAFSAMIRSAGSRKKQNPVTMLLIGAALLYAAGAIEFLLYMIFDSLTLFFEMGVGWLYYAMAGIMTLGIAVIGSVFMTQNQMYDARDNEMLLAMPIPPAAILFSRMAVLLLLNAVLVLLVMGPAGLAAVIHHGIGAAALIGFLIACLGLTLLAQALACAFGWLLHQMLSRISNKAIASVIYMVVFFAVYFAVYTQASRILNTLLTNGMQIADFVRKKAWPLLVFGEAVLGEWKSLLIFAAFSAAVFAAVYVLLAKNFVRTVTTKRSGRRRVYKSVPMKTKTVKSALCGKELRCFLSTPVYLTNQGLGLLMMPAAAIAALIFRDYLGSVLELMEPFLTEGMFAGAILVFIGFLLSMACISAPSVSLEGKFLWILRSMPVTGKEIVRAKLLFHLELCVPVTLVSGIIAGAAFGCSMAELVLIGAGGCVLAMLCGLLGLLCNLRFPRFDWINAAGPCKQSAAVLLTMIGVIAYTIGPAVLYIACLADMVSALWYTAAYVAVSAALCGVLYRILITWGANRLDETDV